MSNYTKEAGRLIVKDGKPLCTLHGVNTKWAGYDPVELDEFTDTVVQTLNAQAAMLEALKATHNTIVNILTDSQLDTRIPCGVMIRDYISTVEHAIALAKGQPTP